MPKLFDFEMEPITGENVPPVVGGTPPGETVQASRAATSSAS
jgi:hypothetical protein